MTMCGTGGWNGPLSGDPDNNVILSTVSSYGGVRVSWTMPTTYPFAVAHIAVYRSTANNFSGSTLLATVNSSFYFDENLTNNTITYYYWIVVVSIHGTYGNVVGPSVAVSRPTIEHVIELLTGRIDQDVLALSLKEKISNIAVLNTSITTEISNRIAANQALITTIAGLDADVAAAVTAIETQTIQRITDNSAMASQLNLVAAGLADSIAGVAESVTALATPTNAFSEWQLATEATLNGNTTAGQIGLVSQVNTLDGTVGSLYTVKLDTNGLIGGYGMSNDGLTVEAGFDVDKFWVGRSVLDPVTQQVIQVKPFIIVDDEVFIDSAMINKLMFTKLTADDGSFVVTDGQLTADYINSNNLTIRDASGNVLFGAGKALDWANVGGSGKPQDGATRNIARGAWTAATNYVVGDSVTYETHSWQCLQANTATTTNKPPTYPVGTNQWWMITVVGGATGTSGQGQVKGISFLRAATAPAVPLGGTFASPNAAGWSDGIPADNNQSLWMVTRIFTSDGLAPQQAAWTTPQKIGTPSIGVRTVFSIDGATLWHTTPSTNDAYMATQSSVDNGATWGATTGSVKIKGEAGSNTAIVYAYRRSATTLTTAQTPGDSGDAAAGASSYVFSTRTLTLPIGSAWSVTIPAGTSPLYVSTATASSITDTDSIAASEWSDAVILVSNGIAGLNVATVSLYMRTSTNVAPNVTDPTGSVTFTFSTGAISGTLPTSSGGTWTSTIPTTGGRYLWITSATASSNTATDTIAYTEWSASKLQAQDGAGGQGQVKGVSFIRLTATPQLPTGGTFASPNATSVDTQDGGSISWSDGIPVDNNKSLWMSTRIFTSDGLTPQQATWTTPQKVGTPSTGTRSVFSVLGTTAAIGTTDATWHLVPAVADVYMATQTSTDNGVTWSAPTGAVRIKGETGSQGTQGIAGTAGTNGVTYYTWVKYADSPTSGMNDFPDGKAYLGIAYNKTTATESSDYNQYSWSLILGAQGIQGVAGTDGASTYTWIKYGTDAVGSGMNDSPVGKTYIGIAVNKPTATESTTASDYTWTLIKGDTGAAGINGTNGTRTAILDLYQWAALAPTVFPTGTSIYTWATGQFTNPVTMNSWTAVPGAAVAGQSLYIARQVYADTATTATSSVTWAVATAKVLSGAGSNGQRLGVLEVYQWAASAPSLPTGTSTYTWATGAFTAPSTPLGWSLLPGAAVVGQTLWGTSVSVSDALTTATSVATWTGGSAYAVGAAGSNGTNGTNGKTYDLTLTGGVRSVTFDATGASPVPAQTAFACTLYENGLSVTPATYSWSATGHLSGASATASYTPTCAGTFSASNNDTVALTVTYAGQTITRIIPIAVVKIGASGTNGTNGTNGKTYDLTLTGGVRSVTFDATGASPVPAQTAFACTLYENGLSVTPATYSWSATGHLSGASATASYTPTCASAFSATNNDTVKLTVTYAGQTITRIIPIAVVKIGSSGTNGTRGTRILYDVKNGAGSAGYNSLTTYDYNTEIGNSPAYDAGALSYAAKATALILTATGTAPIAGDTVYLSNGTNFVNTLSYTGSTWANPGVIVDGSLLVTGSVSASKINSNGLDVKAADGTVILSAGSTIVSQMGVNTNIVQDTATWTLVNGSSLYTASLTSVDGTTLVLPASVLSQCLSPIMDISGLGLVYSVSFKARASVARTLYVDFQPDTMPDASFALTTSWAYYSAVMTVAGTVTNTDRQNCKLRFYGLAVAGAIEVADIKLEVGNVATLWVSNRNALVGLKNPITQTNVSTYIANAAIGNLQVANAAITSAKIGDAEVGTLKIAGNAVTVPTTSSASGTGASVTVTMDYASPVVVLVLFNSARVSDAYFYLYRNGTLVRTIYTNSSGGVVPYMPVMMMYIDYPGVGNFTYTLGSTQTVGDTTIFVLGAKR